MSGNRFLLVGGHDEIAGALGEALAASGALVAYAGSHHPGAALPFTRLDLDNPALLAGQVAALSPFDAALLLPGWREFGPFMGLHAANWDEAIGQNFTHMTYAAQAMARRLIAEGRGGRLIFVTSALALQPFAGAIALGTTLAALHGIARMAAVDLAPHGVTVNVLAPGWLNGPQFDALPGPAQAHIRAGIPLGRPVNAEEIASAVRFLASEAGSAITGTILPLDGGYTLTPASGRTLFDAG